MNVLFRYRPEPSASAPEPRGEMHHWNHPAAMGGGGGGWHELTIEVPVGAYEYKYRHADDDWRLDPENPRTRSCDGVKNSLLVVGGTDEPVIHVPARPYIFVADDGRVCVRAALRRSAGQALALRWNEGAGARTEAMVLVGAEDEHLLFEAWLPGVGRALEYLFVLPNGQLRGHSGQLGQAFEVPLARVKPDAPTWWRRAVVYSIFVDRFRRGGSQGHWMDPLATDRATRAGGDLRGVAEALPYLVDLGVDTIHLTPICRAPSVHRYDAVEPRRVDRELGGEAALLELLESARDQGIRVILDVTVTHVDREFFAFRDVALHGEKSRYWDWFHIYAHPFSEGLRPGYQHYQKGQWREPLLNTSNPEVADYLIGTFAHWARAGADGFRIDAAADVPVELCRRIRQAVRAVRKDAVVLAEIVPSHVHRWTCSAVDAATDFDGQRGLLGFLQGHLSAAALADKQQRRRFRRGAPGWASVGFTGTHDQPRVRTILADAALARLAQLWTLSAAATPMLYYGDEVGLASAEADRCFEDTWPDRQCMPWDPADWDPDSLAVVRQTLRLRRSRAALHRGDERVLDYGDASTDVIGLRRQAGGEIVDVIINRASEAVDLPLTAAAAEILVVSGDARIDGNRLILGPRSGVLLDRSPAREHDAELLAHNRSVAIHAYHEGMLQSPALPAHLYLTVTEACNLRCRHCITDAPGRTRSGTARELRPWVLDALVEPFAAAEYIGFTHGGESLASNRFDQVLDAISSARDGLSLPAPQIHLATNGMLLTPARARDLAARGVTSLMVSIDGATAATNDSIREGAELERVLANLRGVLEFREREGVELRVGISTVVGRANLAELPALGTLVRELGVDWLKIEETYPATAFARADLVRPKAQEVGEAVRGLRAELEGASLVLIDHLDPPVGCRCDGQDNLALRAFRDADDFANGARFAPCRAAWEVACVDPDGTVHAIDYARTALGSLRDAPFAELWNGPIAQRARAAALEGRSAQRRRRCSD